MSPDTPVADMNLEDLKSVVRQLIREELSAQEPRPKKDQRALLEWKPVTLGLRADAPQFISREDFYDSNNR
jgi:hypothetical protein